MAKKQEAEAPKQEVAEAQTKAVATATDTSAWGTENIAGSDLIVPKILLMQGMSKQVMAGEAIVGQIRDSLTGVVLGGIVDPKTKVSKPIEFIPFSMFKTWVIFEHRNGKDEYVKTVPMTAENAGWKLEEVVDGVQIRRDYTLNYNVLLVNELKEGMAFPYLISFRRTSAQAGKKLSTIAAKNATFGKPMAYKHFLLGCEYQENDKGKFYVLTLDQGETTTPDELAKALEWYQKMKTAAVKYDESDLREESASVGEGAALKEMDV